MIPEGTRMTIGAFVGVNDCIKYLGGMSRSNFYANVLPRLHVVKQGKRTMVTADSLEQYVAQVSSETSHVSD